MATPPYFTAAQAAKALGVTRATLYAYASRGQLRSEGVPGRTREHRYSREDIERLQERQEVRRDPAKVAARGLRWGAPVLESAITLIHDGAFYYRGRDAVQLAETATVESVAALLWNVDDREWSSRLFRQPPVLSARLLRRIHGCSSDPLTRMQIALPMAAAVDEASYDLRPAGVSLTGARILRLLTTVIAGRSSLAPIHQIIEAAWAPRQDAVGEAVRVALVLCADHELNVSAFTARCAASAGASPYDVVSAALATLKGDKHGGGSQRALTMLAEADTPRAARAALVKRLGRGEDVPGFGHRLYPGGDPRATALMHVAEASRNEAALRRVARLRQAGWDTLQSRPNLDFGLAAVASAYRLPDHATILLFALGRTIGWIAHATEEYASGQLIRPRARYVGPTPS